MFKLEDRVQLLPHTIRWMNTIRWMRGDRYGSVVGVDEKVVQVLMDKSQIIANVGPNDIKLVEDDELL